MCRLYWKKTTQDRQEKIESQRYWYKIIWKMTCHDTKIYLIFNPPLNFSPRTICNTNDARTVKLFHPFRRNRQTSRHIHTSNLTIINQVHMSKSRARFWVICMRRLIDKHNSLLFPDPGLTDVVPRVEKLIVTL